MRLFKNLLLPKERVFYKLDFFFDAITTLS